MIHMFRISDFRDISYIQPSRSFGRDLQHVDPEYNWPIKVRSL